LISAYSVVCIAGNEHLPVSNVQNKKVNESAYKSKKCLKKFGIRD
jgi:hypothetical protein